MSTAVRAFCPWTTGLAIKRILLVVHRCTRRSWESVAICLGWVVSALCLPVFFDSTCILLCSRPVFLNRWKCWILASVPSRCRCQGNSLCTGNSLQKVLPFNKGGSTAQGPTWGPAEDPPLNDSHETPRRRESLPISHSHVDLPEWLISPHRCPLPGRC